MSDLPSHLGGHLNRTHVDRGALLYFLSRHNVRTMLDIGCGPGGQVKLARAMGIDAKGIDGDPQVKPEILHDFTTGKLDVRPRYDLAWSVEFLEHVEEQYLPNVMPVFQRCRLVCITHALPGKSGHHHVNCQLPDYWIVKFADAGFIYDLVATRQMRAASTMTREFIQNTGMVFRRADGFSDG